MDVDSAFLQLSHFMIFGLQWSHVLMDVDRGFARLARCPYSPSFNGATS